MKSWKLAALLGITIALTGCISLVPPSNVHEKFRYLPWEKRQERLSKQHYFEASGAFSIAKLGEKTVFANYQWIQNNTGLYRIRVSSALNLFNIVILGRLHSVTLWKGSREHVTAPNPELLIKREMGWTLPIQHLSYWILGLAAPGPKNLTFDKYGHLATLKQNGWFIQYSNYTTVKGYDLPQKLTLHRPHAAITIVIKRWILTRKGSRLR